MGWQRVSPFVRSALGCAGAIALTLAAPAAAAPPVFGPAHPLGSNTTTDTGTDAPPALATSGHGTWIAVWESNDTLGGTIGTDPDLLFTRSSDDGGTWSPTAPLDPLAAADNSNDGSPAIASDGQGTWVVVWRSSRRTLTTGGDFDLFFSRSTDDGVTWSPATVLHAQFTTDSRPDDQPVIAADGHGGWVVAWRAVVGDADIWCSHSLDGGATWSAPAPLNQNAGSDTGTDQLPALATDRDGTWIAVWSSTDSLGGTIGTDAEILFARSMDTGLTWSAPRALYANAASNTGTDTAPAIAADGDGGWLVAWQSNDTLGGTKGADYDVLAVHSSDGGGTWSAPAPVAAYAKADTSVDTAASVACSSPLHCAVAWQSNDTLANTLGSDLDILLVTTQDGGATWAAPAALDPRAAFDTGADQEPVLVADAQGTWMATCQSSDTFGGTKGADFDPVFAVGVEPPVCGDGVLRSPELCDDGNLANGDGCRADCTPELCGDGIVDPGEACDDANDAAGDGCRADCTVELCGDGVLDPNEACDDGNLANGDGCRADCTIEACGDGILDPSEGCDDGNVSSGDGCSAGCQVEAAPPTSPPPPGSLSLLERFDQAVADGTLFGVGPRPAARERLRVLRDWLAHALAKLERGRGQAGCALLTVAFEHLDGRPAPRDFAQGPAAPDLALAIVDVGEDAGCFAPSPRKASHGRR